MDTSEAIKRLDALDAEAQKLRKIIEQGDALKYNKRMLYIAIIEGKPYLLAGNNDGTYFRWHSFERFPTEQGWAPNHKTAQAALDYLNHCGKVYVFSDCFEGLKFFYDSYMALE